MRFDIVSIGALVVEIIRKGLDVDFHSPGDFSGPFPSGDTPIFINAAAKLGMRCGFIGTVGDDGFGRCLTERFAQSGVDTSCIRTIPDRTTGTTFVSYNSDGSRKFLYHLHHSAAAMLNCEDVQPGYLDTKWLHLSGFALSGNKSSQEAALKTLEYIGDDVKVSFDPNIRPEAMGVEELREVAWPILERADLVLPSGGEAKAFMQAESDDAACKQLVGMGKLVAQKMGGGGCRIYHGSQTIDVPSFTMEERDPTGAGDTFCAAFIAGLIAGKPLYDIGLFANAAAGLSITKVGPMEGAPCAAEVEEFLSHRAVQVR